jgi:hypothetical protein
MPRNELHLHLSFETDEGENAAAIGDQLADIANAAVKDAGPKHAHRDQYIEADESGVEQVED